MEETPKNIGRCLAALYRLTPLLKFPEGEHAAGALQAYAEVLCAMVHDKPISEILNPREPHAHEVIGDGNDLDWLIRSTLVEEKFFPPPITLRERYTRYLPPADGVEVEVGE